MSNNALATEAHSPLAAAGMDGWSEGTVAPNIEIDGAAQISAFDEILARFEQNTLTERDKGTAFELLVRTVLSETQPWCEQFVKVQTYAEWAKEHDELTGGDARDTGIDLVATNRISDDTINSLENTRGGGRYLIK